MQKKNHSPSKAFFFLHSVLEKIQQQHCYVFHHLPSFKLTRAQMSTSHITSQTCIFLLSTSVKDNPAGVAQILTEDKTGSDSPQALQPTHQHYREQVGSSLQLPAGQPVLPHLAVHYTAGCAQTQSIPHALQCPTSKLHVLIAQTVKLVWRTAWKDIFSHITRVFTSLCTTPSCSKQCERGGFSMLVFQLCFSFVGHKTKKQKIAHTEKH